MKKTWKIGTIDYWKTKSIGTRSVMNELFRKCGATTLAIVKGGF